MRETICAEGNISARKMKLVKEGQTLAVVATASWEQRYLFVRMDSYGVLNLITSQSNYLINFQFIVVLALLLTLCVSPASAHYRAVVLPFAPTSEIDQEALGISDDGRIVGMLKPKTNDFPAYPILWSPNGDTPDSFKSQGYALTNADGGTPFMNGFSTGIDATTNDVIGYVWLGSTQTAFYQTGFAIDYENGIQALAWENLAPSAADGSVVLGADNGVAVGAIRRRSTQHIEAALWEGNPYLTKAGQHISLHPIGWHHSYAEDTNSMFHVGHGGPTANDDEALLWIDANTMPVNLHPFGYLTSRAQSIDAYNNRIVGWGDVNVDLGLNRQHALVWNSYIGSFDANHYTDLNPSGFDVSSAEAVAPGVIAGWGKGTRTGKEDRAIYWPSAAPDTAFDLHQFLPAGFVSSKCTDVNNDGTIVGTATNVNGVSQAIAWIPVSDFYIQHDKPVLHSFGTSAIARGSVVFNELANEDRIVEISVGLSRTKVTIPAGQYEGRFSIKLSLARNSGRSQHSFQALSKNTVRSATLTVIQQQLSLLKSFFPL